MSHFPTALRINVLASLIVSVVVFGDNVVYVLSVNKLFTASTAFWTAESTELVLSNNNFSAFLHKLLK